MMDTSPGEYVSVAEIDEELELEQNTQALLGDRDQMYENCLRKYPANFFILL